MKSQYVDTLVDGDVVNDYFVATRKDLRDTQNGGKFLGMVFKDKTGDVGGVLWNNAPSVAALFEVGDVVNVRGTINTYQNRLQVRVDQVLPLKDGEYDPEDLVASGENSGEALEKFLAIMGTVENEWLKQLLNAFFDDARFMEKFEVAAAGKKWHHAHRGGLAQHCFEMATIAETMCGLFPNIDRDVLMTGVFVHDIGKLYEMTHNLFVEYTTAGRLIGHLQIGSDMVNGKIRDIDGFPEDLRMQVIHLILSHHGEMTFGSPVVPKTVEAIVLYMIDNLDAQADAFTRVVKETSGKRQEWSDYLNLIQRQIWTKES